VEPFLIASTIKAISYQRLVRRLGEEHDVRRLTREELDRLRRDSDLDGIFAMLRREKIIDERMTPEEMEWGWPKKSDLAPDGYKGRIGIHEVLSMSDAIRALIMKNATSEQIEEQARKEGMLTMREEGMIHAAQRMTSIEEVLRVTSD
jgi:type II secretory ATPase GspE/PulE/Tfp pilus assembly ATPase PilB-like protein